MGMSDIQKIKEVLPENWKCIHSEESWGSLGHLGIAVIACTPVALSDETCNEVYRAMHKAKDEIEKDVLRNKPDFNENVAKEKADLLACFGNAPIYVEQIPNEYWPDSYAITSPWYKVTTPVGHFKIGWRKRVIVIDWTATNVSLAPEDLFPDEDVTKSRYTPERWIHAWGYDKATEYIGKILKFNGKDNNE